MNYHLYRSDTKLKNECDHREVTKVHNLTLERLNVFMPMFAVGLEAGEVHLFPTWCDVSSGIIGVAAYINKDMFYLVVSTDNINDDEIVTQWFNQLHDKEMELKVLEHITAEEVKAQMNKCFDETDNYEIYLNRAHELMRCHYVEVKNE